MHKNLQESFNQSSRSRGEHSLALAIFFKKLKETRGHQKSGEVFVAITQKSFARYVLINLLHA
ncbi:MAG: hypothetical protein ACJAUT_001085 [Cellvibrionaceae bacterium]|jgi:hypothetical protein